MVARVETRWFQVRACVREEGVWAFVLDVVTAERELTGIRTRDLGMGQLDSTCTQPLPWSSVFWLAVCSMLSRSSAMSTTPRSAVSSTFFNLGVAAQK
jgi:hypothetical protein